MSKCDYCGSTIIFGGKRDANGRFCNQKCQARGALLAISRQLPEANVQEEVWKALFVPQLRDEEPGRCIGFQPGAWLVGLSVGAHFHSGADRTQYLRDRQPERLDQAFCST